MTFPLPSSPHCAPTKTMLDINSSGQEIVPETPHGVHGTNQESRWATRAPQARIDSGVRRQIQESGDRFRSQETGVRSVDDDSSVYLPKNSTRAVSLAPDF